MERSGFQPWSKDYDLHLLNQIVQARKGNNFIMVESEEVKRQFGTFAEGFTLDDARIIEEHFG